MRWRNGEYMGQGGSKGKSQREEMFFSLAIGIYSTMLLVNNVFCKYLYFMKDNLIS